MYDKPDAKTMFLSRYGSAKHVNDVLNRNDLRDSYTEKIIENPHTTKEQFTRMIPHASDLSLWGMEKIAGHHNVPDHIKHEIMNAPHLSARPMRELLSNPSFAKEDLSHLVGATNMNSYAAEIASHHHYPMLDKDIVSKWVTHPDPYVKRQAFNKTNIHISPDHIKTAMQDQDEFVRYRAIMHPHADVEEVVHYGKHDPSDLVRLGAIKNMYAPKELIQHAAEHDPDEDNRTSAKRILETTHK